MNRLTFEKRTKILHLLCEGNSIRATSRIMDVSKNTVTKLLLDVGFQCLDYQDEVLRDLPCKRLQCGEIWTFTQKNIPKDKKDQFDYGDVWTWTAICADTKLVPCWHIGNRGTRDAKMFIDDLAGRMASRVQLTTDGHKVYLEAAECVGFEKQGISGQLDPQLVSTSYVEQQNLTMRMSLRRFTHPTNAFSKKVENLAHAVSLHYMYYNFVRIHKSLCMTPAMAAGVSIHVWEMEEIAALDD